MPVKRLTWNDLNERQQKYMLIIYQTDQIQERNAKGIMRMEMRSIPADRWRWIEYADTFVGHTPFKRRLKEAGLVDPGTGSTFEALRDRELILVRGEVQVRLTTKGRAFVRKALKDEQAEALPLTYI